MRTPPAPDQIHRSFLFWRNFLYGKVALGASLVALLVYAFHTPIGPPNGGTWVGYTYGTIGFILIVWLAWFGIRRKQYGKKGLLEDWLSAHVYLGLSLLIIGTLHTGFRLHNNVHTLAYGLMILVILSGAYGAYAFWRYPSMMTDNRAGTTLDKMLAELASIDADCHNLALRFDEEIYGLVKRGTDGIGKTHTFRQVIFGDKFDPLSGPIGEAIGKLKDLMGTSQNTMPQHSGALTEILNLVQRLTRRSTLIVQIRKDRLYRIRLLLWRAIHVPLSIGLIAALLIHIFVVFFYW